MHGRAQPRHNVHRMSGLIQIAPPTLVGMADLYQVTHPIALRQLLEQVLLRSAAFSGSPPIPGHHPLCQRVRLREWEWYPALQFLIGFPGDACYDIFFCVYKLPILPPLASPAFHSPPPLSPLLSWPYPLTSAQCLIKPPSLRHYHTLRG